MNDDQARSLLPALAAGTLEGRELGELLSYLETAPHLRREADRLARLLDRAAPAPEAPPASVWSALEAEIAKDVTHQASARLRGARAALTDGGEALIFGKIALNWRLISRDLLDRALLYQRQQEPGKRLGEILLEKGILSQSQVNEILAYQTRIGGLRSAQARSPHPDRPRPDVGETATTAAGGGGWGTPAVSPALAGFGSGTPTAMLPPVAFGGALSDSGDLAMSDPHDDPLLGTKIGGCTINAKIGQGGMGAIYLAHHESLRKDVVLKLLPPDAAANPRTVERFFREARAAARLEHPNVVTVQDVGTTDRGLHYIIMQYVDGLSLEEHMREHGAQELKEALRITMSTARALEAAHKAEIIHRDIKAENIMLSRAGKVLVTDFGLAKDLNSELKLTADGAMIGTPLYMAPEIGRVKQIDGRVDVYSLGVTFYYLLTGIQPFRGFSALEILAAKAHDKLAPPEEHRPDLPEDYRKVLGKMLVKDRDARYADMSALLRDLEALERGYPVEADMSPWEERGAAVAARKSGRKKAPPRGGTRKPASKGGVQPALIVALIAAAVIVFGLIGFLILAISD